MSFLFTMLSLLLAAVAALSAVADFKGMPNIVELMKRLGYRPGFERMLGIVKLVGAAGLLIGLFEHFVGVAAALGFTAYFALAARAHRTVDDSMTETAPALVLTAASFLAFIAGLAS